MHQSLIIKKATDFVYKNQITTILMRDIFIDYIKSEERYVRDTLRAQEIGLIATDGQIESWEKRRDDFYFRAQVLKLALEKFVYICPVT